MNVRVECKGSGLIDISDIKPFQGKLKELTTENYEKLKKQILTQGFSAPFFLWDKTNECLDGHQRHNVLIKMRSEGISVPQLPYVQIFAKTRKQAKEKLLSFASQYGRMTTDGLYEFLADSEISFEEAKDSFSFPDVDFDKFEAEFFEKPLSKEEASKIYSEKIKSPIYEPKGDKPLESDLVDQSKTEQLLVEIEKANVDLHIKEFLKIAAQRHLTFNYQQIAEYYSHAPEEVQTLMEQSALVIIDFKQAIENGFVLLAQDIADAYTADES